ncbi:E3 ubiquitin-protein ligase TRIM56 [Holothuria leucospilota]|uniref:E3 ubiquitin-protein ligase TRIM56 n=1 Tax=Holothuria leucospilota TaxID=206669 RepID=A0A9Q1C2Z8_HOLLE|nr:E3 ubiquitin-protein ligase TRIM56 [Holothuria leucospilota]
MEKEKPKTNDVMAMIKERFCICPLCNKLLDDPRRLPCAHRFCLECLDKAMYTYQTKEKGQFFPCPKCQQDVPIPSRGAAEIKADFWATEMMAISELRDKLTASIGSGDCVCCSNSEELIAFCKECDGFVCSNCCNLHEKLGVLKTHKNIFKLDENLKKNKSKIDLKRLVSISGIPKCKDHKNMDLELSCRTCDDRLICLKCAFVRHSDHEKQEVSDAVVSMKEELQQERIDVLKRRDISLASRKQNEANADKMAGMFDNIASGIENKYKLGMEKFEQEEQILTAQDREGIQRVEKSRDVDVTNMEKDAEDAIEEVQREMMMRITQINNDLSAKLKNRKDNAQKQIDAIEARMNAKKKDINVKRQRLENDRENLLQIVASCRKTTARHLNECNKNIDATLIRLQYVKENVDAVVAVSSDWAFVDTVSDLLLTLANLKTSLDQTKMESNSLHTPTLSFSPSEDHLRLGSLMWTLNKQFNVVDGGRFRKDNWTLEDVTALMNGNLAVAGSSATTEAGIDFISPDGKPYLEKDFLFEDKYVWCLSKADEYRLVACRGSNIEVLNVSNGDSVKTTNVTTIPRWRADDRIASVAYDNNMGEIIVSREKSNEIAVFDRELKYLRSFKMPGPSKGPFTLTVSGDVMLACNLRKGGHAMGIDLGTVNVLARYPPLENDHVSLAICCDSADSVYVLWKRKTDSCVVVYDGPGEPKLGLPVHPAANTVTVTKAKDGSESLVVGTPDGRLAYYKLPLKKSTSWDNYSSWFEGIKDEILDRYLSRRAQWRSTAQKYELKNPYDFELKSHQNTAIVQEPNQVGADLSLFV